MLDKIIESIKDGNPDYQAIIDFTWNTLRQWPAEKKAAELAPLKTLLTKQEVSEEILWIMAAFQLDELLDQTLRKDFSKKIDFNFCPATPNATSIIYYLARKKLGEFIKYILLNPQKFTEPDWSAVPLEGPYKGVPVFWFLVAHQQWELVQQILDKNPQLIAQINWNAAPAAGPDKDISVFWCLIARQQWELVKQILDKNPQLIAQINWNAAPAEGRYKGASVFWCLVASKQWGLVQQILDKNPQLMAQINWHAASVEGPHKGKSVWKLLVENQQWNLIELIVANPNLSLQHADQNDSVYAHLLQCDDLQQRARLIKTYLLSNANPEPIPEILKTQIQPYQQELQTAFETVATLLNDWDENNFFEATPPELREIVLKHFLYEIDTDFARVPWRQLETAFYNHLDKRTTQLQIYACRALAWHACRFFQEQQLSSQNIHQHELPGKATVARWIAEENQGKYDTVKLCQSERKLLLAELKKQFGLTKETVQFSFYQTFKPALLKHCQVLKKLWDIETCRNTNDARDRETNNLERVIDELVQRPRLDLVESLLSGTKEFLLHDHPYREAVLSLKRNLEETLIKQKPQCLELLDTTIKLLQEFIQKHDVGEFEKIQISIQKITENKILDQAFKTQSHINLIYEAKAIAASIISSSTSSSTAPEKALQSIREKFLQQLSGLSIHDPESLKDLLSFIQDNPETSHVAMLQPN